MAVFPGVKTENQCLKETRIAGGSSLGGEEMESEANTRSWELSGQ